MARNWIDARRREAWAHGRALRDRLLTEFCERYQLEVSPPPAKVIDELLTEHLNVRLLYDPLPLDRFAETSIKDGEIVVTVNSETGNIGGVKDALGVQNVGKWHELIHVVDHRDALQERPQLVLDGFAAPPPIVCYRSGAQRATSETEQGKSREFWAEEAGRAAAVSLPALRRTEPFLELLDRARRAQGPLRSAFPLLYQAGEAIGVNISALTKQLRYEGLIVIERNGPENSVFVQPGLLESTP